MYAVMTAELHHVVAVGLVAGTWSDQDAGRPGSIPYLCSVATARSDTTSQVIPAALSCLVCSTFGRLMGQLEFQQPISAELPGQ